jgi:acetolactate synthase I/II/III large subunit
MTKAISKTCGEVLVELLQSYGIDIVFGIPGVHTVELYRGLPNTRLRHITPRHEQGAGFMADGYARVTGKPAACFIISGPGMTNIITAMAQAYSDSVPMLVISSVNNSHELALGQGRLHELPSQRQLVAGVSVFSHTVARPNELAEVLARAFAVFDSARPGPVHIELPLDVITAAMSPDDLPRIGRRYRPGPSSHAIADAAAMLRSATNPFIVLGGGTQDAAEEARLLVDRLGVRTVLTVNAKGVLAADHPLNLGSRLPQAPVLEALQSADVVLAIGTELGETDTLLFDDQLRLAGQVIRVDIESEQITRNVLPTVSICADAGLAMAALFDALADCKSFQHQAEVRELRQAADALAPEAYRQHGRILDLVAETLPGVVIVGDSTQPVYGGNLFYEAAGPRRYFNSSTGYGTLGFGLPAAFGAKLALPDTPVVSLIGDGGLQFTIGELATAVELEIGVPILVWNNNGYGEIKRYMVERDIPTIGVDIYTPDFITIAKGFGCAAETADTREAFVAALLRANAASKPTLIDIPEHLALTW